MAVLSAVFKAVDQLSDVLDRMSAAGATALERWERSAGAADDALSRAMARSGQGGRPVTQQTELSPRRISLTGSAKKLTTLRTGSIDSTER